MTQRLRLVFVCLFLAVSALAREARAASSPCDVVTTHRSDTVIVFTPPSSFAICYDGHEVGDVVTGRRVYLQLAPSPGSAMFWFRVHGQAAEPRVTGLSELRKRTRALAEALEELGHSSQHIAAMSSGGEATPLGAARARYLGVVTPRFDDALRTSRRGLHDLAEAVGTVDRWCHEIGPATSGASRELVDACRSATSLHDVSPKVAAFEHSAAAFDAARDLAREAVITSAAHGDDAASSGDAARLLDLARGTADALVRDAKRLAGVARTTEQDLGAVRLAIGAIGALRPGVPVYLATYGESGNALLRMDTVPVGVDVADRSAEETNASFRFPVVARHYFDVEVGAGVTGGQPLIPTVATSGNASVIDGKAVDQFVALALVELEPFRFGWPDSPLAGLVRFPVIGIPLSRDPTQNFFVGGGIGWTGVGSITAGPYLLRELTLDPGHAIGDTLPPGTSLDAITTPQVNVGFFVSASIDLVGLYHLFFHEHEPTLDAATGREQ